MYISLSYLYLHTQHTNTCTYMPTYKLGASTKTVASFCPVRRRPVPLQLVGVFVAGIQVVIRRVLLVPRPAAANVGACLAARYKRRRCLVCCPGPRRAVVLGASRGAAHVSTRIREANCCPCSTILQGAQCGALRIHDPRCARITNLPCHAQMESRAATGCGAAPAALPTSWPKQTCGL